ncbi:phosphorylase [Nannochloropsis oceanica]
MASHTSNTIKLTEGSKRYTALWPKPPVGDVDLAATRATVEYMSRLVGGRVLPMRRVEDIPLTSLDGSSPFFVRNYFPTLLEEDKVGEQKLGVILYSHGGGGMVGSVASYDSMCRRIAATCHMAVVSVDYRLTPEHPYPAALEDMEAAFQFVVNDLVMRQYPEVLDPGKVVLMGDSFGGHLAASLLLRLHRKEEYKQSIKPKACVLIYPSVDMKNARHPSFSTHANVSHLTPEMINMFFNAYLPDKNGNGTSSSSSSSSSRSDHYSGSSSSSSSSCNGNGCSNNTEGLFQEELRLDPDVSVLYSTHLHLFPPTLVLSAACDPLIDEGILFVKRLREEKVDVRHVIYPEIIHGFFSGYDMFPEAEMALGETANFLKEGLRL